MGIYIDPELRKPLQCSACGGQKIANMLNEGVIRCLDCGKERPDRSSAAALLEREMGSSSGNNVYTTPKNPLPYRPF